MSPENFVYWLQGYLEIQDPSKITKYKVQIIQDHIDLVLTKVTPDRKEKPKEDFSVSDYFYSTYSHDTFSAPDVVTIMECSG